MADYKKQEFDTVSVYYFCIRALVDRDGTGEGSCELVEHLFSLQLQVYLLASMLTATPNDAILFTGHVVTLVHMCTWTVLAHC